MKKLMLFCFLLAPFLAGAQDTPDSLLIPPAGGNPPPGSGTVENFKPLSIWQNPELMSSWAILFVGGIILLVVIFAKSMQRLPHELHVRLIVVVLAIVAALYLIAAGWNSEQAAPAFGLLGAIVGYILGRGDSNPKEQSKSPDS